MRVGLLWLKFMNILNRVSTITRNRKEKVAPFLSPKTPQNMVASIDEATVKVSNKVIK